MTGFAEDKKINTALNSGSILCMRKPFSFEDVEKKVKFIQKSIEQRKGSKSYVFLEGPPTANGLPHPGHVLTRVMKDLVLRYQTMNGHYIERKAGWDTHGLPVEIEV